MSGSTTTNSTQQSQAVQQLPPWINDAAQQNYAFAQGVSQRPLQQYQGQLVAGVAPQTQQAWNTAASGSNAGADQYAGSQAAYMGVLGSTPQTVKSGSLATTDLTPYMNPYTKDVINATLPIMQQNLGLSEAGNAAEATKAGAFGGSRFGLQQGVTQAQGALGMGQLAAELNQGNFGTAQTAAQKDIGSALTASLANQSTQQNQGGLNLSAAAGLSGLGQQAQLSQARNFTEQSTAGTAEQAQAQALINAQYNKFQQAWNYPTQQLGALQSSLGMTPYGSATQGQQDTSTTQTTSPSIASLLTSGLQTLGSLFPVSSDRNLKTDITKIGMHPSGIPMYSYRYKGDPKSYPKVAGPMAEDVAKVAPQAVRPMTTSGRMAVDMGQLDAMSSPRGRSAAGMPRIGIQMGSPNPSMPGPLSGPGVAGGVGALGAAMRPPPRARPRGPRAPMIRGALGG